MLIVSQQRFNTLFFKRMDPDRLVRAVRMHKEYGSRLSFDVTNVLLHATSQGTEKVDVVLKTLEEHYRTHLFEQHPDLRGAVTNALHGNQTTDMFLRLCREVLELEATHA